MTRQQLDDLRNMADVLDGAASNAVKLRDNPDHRKGNARRTDLKGGLSIIEAMLQSVSKGLRDMADQDSGD